MQSKDMYTLSHRAASVPNDKRNKAHLYASIPGFLFECVRNTQEHYRICADITVILEVKQNIVPWAVPYNVCTGLRHFIESS